MLKRPGQSKLTILELCLQEAVLSPCKKRGFGAALFVNGALAGVECNRPIEGLDFLCKNGCIRNGMPSGSDSMIGSCAHAEERLIFQALESYNSLRMLDTCIYVAGVDKATNTPLVRDTPYFYCLRCSTQMLLAGIKRVAVYVKDSNRSGWRYLSALEAAKSSLDFALKQRIA